MDNRRDDTLTALGLLVAGLAVGVTLGLIFAPQPGEETRKHLVKYTDRLLFRFRWLWWSPEEKYRYLWNRTRGEKTS